MFALGEGEGGTYIGKWFGHVQLRMCSSFKHRILHLQTMQLKHNSVVKDMDPLLGKKSLRSSQV